ANTAFLGEDWGQFTPKDDKMRLYLGVAQDIVVRRTTAKNENRRIAGNLNDDDIVLQYEIENFKNQPVKLDVVESIPFVHREVRGNPSRDIQWKIGAETTLPGDPDPERTTFDHVLYHVKLPAAVAGKAEKQIYKLHLIFQNEW